MLNMRRHGRSDRHAASPRPRRSSAAGAAELPELSSEALKRCTGCSSTLTVACTSPGAAPGPSSTAMLRPGFSLAICSSASMRRTRGVAPSTSDGSAARTRAGAEPLVALHQHLAHLAFDDVERDHAVVHRLRRQVDHHRCPAGLHIQRLHRLGGLLQIGQACARRCAAPARPAPPRRRSACCPAPGNCAPAPVRWRQPGLVRHGVAGQPAASATAAARASACPRRGRAARWVRVHGSSSGQTTGPRPDDRPHPQPCHVACCLPSHPSRCPPKWRDAAPAPQCRPRSPSRPILQTDRPAMLQRLMLTRPAGRRTAWALPARAQILIGQTAGHTGAVAATVKEATAGAQAAVRCAECPRRHWRPEAGAGGHG